MVLRRSTLIYDRSNAQTTSFFFWTINFIKKNGQIALQLYTLVLKPNTVPKTLATIEIWKDERRRTNESKRKFSNSVIEQKAIGPT